ncbi:type II toxin-antitoxin system ParD family antitoxin [Halomonas sp. hl-4]|uniref:type II toxin-antitoxin system ParD family antitoxin n=1 Tax=Halomonas sp. hl-4 TaxID=1761789 RepID=UPI000BB7C34C|nr:type II toxin-antitoxin system ParD family antitoxin [Halomonas sp. hl-4]SNY95860.1 antitoxin ParD1/3/4 [Halomonas sp. hl-4]
MSMHRKTITLTEQQNDWVKGQIESGHFGNDSEYIRDLVRRDQQAKERLATLRQALAEGESSGKPMPLDIAAIKATGRKRMKTAN